MDKEIIVIIFVIFILLIFFYVKNLVLNSFCNKKNNLENFSNTSRNIYNVCYNNIKPFVKGRRFTSDSIIDLINNVISCLNSDTSLDDLEKKKLARKIVSTLLVKEGNYENSGIFDTTNTNNYIAKGYDNLSLYSNYKQNGAYDIRYKCLDYKVVSGKANKRNNTFAELLQQSCFGTPDRQYSYITDKNLCLSNRDLYGKTKTPGIWSPKCKKNSDCPDILDELDNNRELRGKCLKDGYCRIPYGTTRIGFRHYSE